MSKKLPLAGILVFLLVLSTGDAVAVEFDSLEVELSVEVTDPPRVIGIPTDGDPIPLFPRVGIEFAAHIGVANAIDPLNDDVQIQIANEHVVNILIPAGCFERRGNRLLLADWQGCGVSLGVVHSYTDTFDDLTPGIQFFDAHLRPLRDLPGWHLGIDTSFSDIREIREPSFAPLLGGAEKAVVMINNHHGETFPKKIHVAFPPNLGINGGS